MTFLTQSNRIEAVRQLMADHGLDALLIPRSDDFQGENVPENAERLAWLTGFDGSVGKTLNTPKPMFTILP
jgi:Xaa-Pro aminopeptidase